MNDEYANTSEEPADERDAATVVIESIRRQRINWVCLKKLLFFQIKTLYQELADKEQALLLAAQFGKSLIEEKEDLEKQIEFSKQDQLNKIEVGHYIFFLIYDQKQNCFVQSIWSKSPMSWGGRLSPCETNMRPRFMSSARICIC